MTHEQRHLSNQNIKTAFFLNAFFTVFELVGGYFTNSIAITTDAIHDLGDTIALGSSWYLDSFSKKPRSKIYSYGFGRFSLLSALVTGLVLLIGTVIALSEAIPRLVRPEHSDSQGMIGIALVGICINGVSAYRLKSGQTMSEKIVSLHVLEDVGGWIAVLIAGIVMHFTDIHILDPALSVLFAFYILWNVLKNLKKTVGLFLQEVPEGISFEHISQELLKDSAIKAVHDIHAWTLDGERNIVTMHVVTAGSASAKDVTDVKCTVKKHLARMHIQHSTIEVEREGEICQLDDC